MQRWSIRVYGTAETGQTTERTFHAIGWPRRRFLLLWGWDIGGLRLVRHPIMALDLCKRAVRGAHTASIRVQGDPD